MRQRERKRAMKGQEREGRKRTLRGIMMDRDMSIVVFNMLPTSVQSRLPAFQSLRRSTSLSILSSRRGPIAAQQKDIDPVVIAERDEDAVIQLQACTAAAATASVTNNKLKKDKAMSSSLDSYSPNERAGVKWRYAAQGMSIPYHLLKKKKKKNRLLICAL